MIHSTKSPIVAVNTSQRRMVNGQAKGSEAAAITRICIDS